MANLGIIGADPSEPPSCDAVVILANRLLSQFNIPTKIHAIEDISAALFVVLYENLFSERLPGIIRQPSCKEDEIHNCHIVIDILSTDVVHDNLSHIRAEDVVSGEITAVSNLLDIFSYLLEYVINKIDSDVPTDVDDGQSISTTEPDLSDIKSPGGAQTKQVRSSIPVPKQEKGKVSQAARNRTNNNMTKTSKRMPSSIQKENKSKTMEDNGSHAVISHEDFYAMSHGGAADSFLNRPPSPIGADHSQSLLGQKSVDSEFGLEQWEKKSQEGDKSASPKIAWDDKPPTKSTAEPALDQRVSPEPFSEKRISPEPYGAVGSALSAADIMAPVTTTTAEGTSSTKPVFSSKYRGPEEKAPSMSASMPAYMHDRDKLRSEPLRSTVGPINYTSQNTTPDKAKISQKSTPDKSRTSQQSTPDKTRKPESKRSKGATGPSVRGFSSSYDDLRHLVEKTAALTRVALDCSPVRSYTERELDITDISRERPRPHISSESARLARELNAASLHSSGVREAKQASSRPNKKVAFLASESKSSYLDKYIDDTGRRPLRTRSDNHGLGDLSTESEEDEEERLFEVDYRQRVTGQTQPFGAASEKERAKRVPTKHSRSKRDNLAKHLARNRQPELGAAHMTLKTEDRALRRKQEILRRMYEEDIDEFADEVNYMRENDAKIAQETNAEYIKQCQDHLPKKKKTVVKKGKAGTALSSDTKKRKVTTRPSRQIPNTRGNATAAPLVVQSEDDLMPLLLAEFPFLHLSEHTWHELWRRGLNQIESLTNAYQASQRKKSQAQSQLEDAAHRHELLANIMKKQLEHTKRLREIKDRKQQHVQVKNRMHEKRAQSARARRYYNEYQVRARGKQLKKRTKEEMVFRELFKDALDIQKERIKDIRNYAKDQRKCLETKRQNEIDSMENFYQNQFALLAEQLAKEKQDTALRDSAQHKMMDRMKRELRKKMEAEIQLYQEQMFRDDDDAHFRQVDADRIRQQLHLAQYSAKI